MYVALVSQHKEESSKKYFESIIIAKVQPGENGKYNDVNLSSSPSQSPQQRQLSPIEVLFHKVKYNIIMYYLNTRGGRGV